jgi:hypothetical protein
MIFVGSESQADNESIRIGDQLLHLFGADVKVIEGYVVLHARHTRPSELGCVVKHGVGYYYFADEAE